MPGGCPRVQVSPKGNRGAQRSQGAPGLRGPPSLRGWYGGMALPGSTARLGLADRVGGTWGSTLGGIPRSTPQQEASCPRSVPTPPKAPAPTPALSMGKLRHGALPCLCPPNPHGLGGPPPSGGGGGGSSGRPRRGALHLLGARRQIGDPWLETPGVHHYRGGDAPLGMSQCHLLPSGLGHPGARGWGGAAGSPGPWGRHPGGAGEGSLLAATSPSGWEKVLQPRFLPGQHKAGSGGKGCQEAARRWVQVRDCPAGLVGPPRLVLPHIPPRSAPEPFGGVAWICLCAWVLPSENRLGTGRRPQIWEDSKSSER